MTRTQLGPVARQLRQYVGVQRTREQSDTQLLERFVAGREEDAFAALLRRHGPLVLGVCRRVLRHEQDAEDAFQATFLTLARHARSIRATEAVGSWLYRVAYRIATKAGLAMARRSALERRSSPAADMGDGAGPELALRELQGLLDAELDRLPEKYRAPFVLCCLEGKSRSEAARELGWKEGTVGGRVAEARKRLQARLARRGVALAAVLTAVAVATPARAVPGVLLDATLRAGLSYAAGRAGVVSASVTALLEGAPPTMWLTKAKLTTALLVLVGIVTAGVAARPQAGKQAEQPGAKPQAADAQPKAAPADDKDAKPKAAPADNKDVATYAGRVLGPDDKPVAGAKLYLLYYTPKSLPVPVRGTSDADGRYRFSVPKAEFDQSGMAAPWGNVLVVAVAEGYGLGMELPEVGKPFSHQDSVLRLAKDDVPLSGRVLDLQGKPAAGVTVRVEGVQLSRKGDLGPFLADLKEKKLYYPPLRDHLTGFEGGWIGRDVGKLFPPAVTGADGRFTIKGIGRERLVDLRFEGTAVVTRTAHAVTRPGDTIKVPGGWSSRDIGEPILVYGATFDHIAAPGKPVVGVVRDKDTGKPIPGAVVTSFQRATHKNFIDTELRTVADKDGRFRLDGLPKGEGNIIRAGPPADLPYLTAWAKVEDTPGLEPVTVDVSLKRGVWISGRVIDKATGKPVHAQMQYAVFEDNPHRKEVPTLANPDQMESRAADGSFRFAGLPGRGLIGVRAWVDKYRIAVGADKIKGLEANGHFRTYPYLVYYRNFHTLIEVNPEPGEPEFKCEIALDPGLTLKGTILDPDGKPLVGAQASGLNSHGYLELSPRPSANFTVTGVDPGEPRLLLFFHKGKNLSGSLVIKGDEKEPLTVKLGPAGTLIGRLVTPDGQPVNDGDLVSLYDPPMPQPGAAPKVDLETGTIPAGRIRPEKDGKFRVEGLVPGLKYKFGVSRGIYLLNLAGAAGEAHTIKAGETKDLGDVVVKPFEQQ